jgi:hypothetical protein
MPYNYVVHNCALFVVSMHPKYMNLICMGIEGIWNYWWIAMTTTQTRQLMTLPPCISLLLHLISYPCASLLYRPICPLFSGNLYSILSNHHEVPAIQSFLASLSWNVDTRRFGHVEDGQNREMQGWKRCTYIPREKRWVKQSQHRLVLYT